MADLPHITVRDAREADIPALVAIGGNPALHRDRIAQASPDVWRYLVGELDGEVVVRACLIFGQPPLWPTVPTMPRIIDLTVRADLRSRGIGSAMIAAMERIAVQRGFGQMWLSVDPETNQRAMRLYERLGYRPTTPAPVWNKWEFLDSDGIRHQGEGRDITMRKSLARLGD